ncbi:glycosyltransferase family protein [Mucilaginibacter myungsuensis]|uniref:Glycosyltransferase n=1 Tax=Mucilaginibacter myungsuensis TaxID=649104 RepID=A0A929PXM2_9SPHI|nr:glycosyltransferase [Mucilaginibacter myungsuensis]MBE9662407.1 glycosyltransferase [Mucilaginibacter myungsuensis]MDN3599156.1 glycosyltransferase [Mucilaginibacter myungsuensis]
MFAPIVFFTYKRLTSVQKVIASLQKCQYVDQTEIYIFSDGPKTRAEVDKVNAVREYLRTIKGFKKVVLKFSDVNKGLATSIIEGITNIFQDNEAVIVLEDDLVVSKNFLAYMNQGIDYYKYNKKIFSISGYNIPMKVSSSYPYDIYLTYRSSSWGWASWRDRWETIDWEVKDYDEFRRSKDLKKAFNKGGSDLTRMLRRQRMGQVNSWAIRWCYHQFKTNTYCVYPIVSKVKNIGFDITASNSNSYDRYNSPIDVSDKTQFKFLPEVKQDATLQKKFSNFYSIRSRIIGRLKTYLFRGGFLSNR